MGTTDWLTGSRLGTKRPFREGAMYLRTRVWRYVLVWMPWNQWNRRGAERSRQVDATVWCPRRLAQLRGECPGHKSWNMLFNHGLHSPAKPKACQTSGNATPVKRASAETAASCECHASDLAAGGIIARKLIFGCRLGWLCHIIVGSAGPTCFSLAKGCQECCVVFSEPTLGRPKGAVK